jgi:hypothetical protein
MIVSTRGSAITRELDGEAVVLHVESGMYFGLDVTGTWIWSRLTASREVPLEQLVGDLVEEFAVERETAERDIREFVEALRANRLVRVQS